MCKTRNTGTGNGMRGTQGMGGMLYSGECRQIFRGMFSNIPGMSSNIPGNVAKHSGECHQILRGLLLDIPGNVIKNSGKRRQTFQGMLPIFGVKGRVAFRILSNIHDGAYLRK